MPETSPLQSIVFKSGFPINTYVLLVSPVVIVLLSLIYNMNLTGLIFYLPAGLLMFYVFFCRYSCRIEILDSGEMRIIYFFPWNKNRVVKLTEYKYVDYGRGFYVFISKRTLGYFSTLRNCFDLIVLSESIKQSQLEIKVNTRMFGFKQVIDRVQKLFKLRLVSIRSTEEVIW